MPLTLDLNTDNPDEMYQSLIDAHEELTSEQSAALNTRLILILSNHIGDEEVVAEAARIARSNLLANQHS